MSWTHSSFDDISFVTYKQTFFNSFDLSIDLCFLVFSSPSMIVTEALFTDLRIINVVTSFVTYEPFSIILNWFYGFECFLHWI